MELADAVTAIEVAVDQLSRADVDDVHSGDRCALLIRMKRAESKLNAQVGRATHAADAAGAFIGTGARDTAEYLARQTGTSMRRNRNAAELGQAMSKSDELAAAVTSGSLSTDKATMLVGAAGDQPVDAALLDEVADLPLSAVRPAVEEWRARSNPDRDADIAASQRSRSYLHVTGQRDGTTRVEGLLDPEAAARVRSTLDGIMNESAFDGTNRTRAQRCADALTQLCTAAAKGKIAGGRSNTKLLATVPFETIVERGASRGRTHVGSTLDPATVRKLACDAGIHRVITGPGSSILDFGHETRLVSENLFLALVARDQHCRWPGCTTRATWCDAHHITHWTDHGETSDENCVLLCHHHHQLSHQPGWKLTGTGKVLRIHRPDGSIEVSKPPGVPTTRVGSTGGSLPEEAAPGPDAPSTSPQQEQQQQPALA